MSFDRLRSALGGLDAWILVLDTKGVNVWCAAGKGTFGTDELVGRAESCRLAEVVAHRTLIVPQLGAPGVAAHEVRQRSGFRVLYGPVRLPTFRPFWRPARRPRPRCDASSSRWVSGWRSRPWNWCRRPSTRSPSRADCPAGRIGKGWLRLRADGQRRDPFGGLVPAGLCRRHRSHAGTLAVASRPGIAAKGAWVGAALWIVLAAWTWELGGPLAGGTSILAWALLILATTSFLAMNFTGATTYTSLSGVCREMRVAVPLQAAAAVAGLVLWVVSRFL